MDTWTLIVGAATFFFAYLGEKARAGAYLWISMLFSVLLALRMANEVFYIVTAGLLAVLAYRTFSSREDVRDESIISKDRE